MFHLKKNRAYNFPEVDNNTITPLISFTLNVCTLAEFGDIWFNCNS